MVRTNTSIQMKIKRGPESWSYIYVALGFALSIEASVVTMIEPLKFPWNLVIYAFVSLMTFAMFINNRWFQSKLIGLKNRYEAKER